MTEIAIASVKVSWVGEDGLRHAEYVGEGELCMEIDLLGVTTKEQALRAGKWQLVMKPYVVVED